ncbi:hypothetical protein SAMN03159355_02173 [Pseudomonas sp. NFPP10]|nr:hypothetical protein C1883_12175 [Pseudomonas protegens]SDA21280.1 hypothetical protein SAMN03159465_02641 [Pseudomonas sp. NFPP12]SEL35377.1 hypothetical protein SAMN03159355_02173 [Pseudomonas sp. NFPP10]SEQ20599.1 hypothetical protein SAMN03159354_01105 [Pseudomonas sp. NFPP19]SFI98058.1 hypothetical protein SAMN03159416_02590 [Pseudomonas sp. NFPP08]SFM64353.1 hypothetical protein SAMN03159476_02223 [Pseudomonas sp. NFPP05]SFX46291.1 hypothetical protein SAMN03159479_02173 [Pseudomonas
MMNKYILTFIFVLGSLVGIQTPAATLGLQAGGTTADGRTKYTVTSVNFTNNEIGVNGFLQGQHYSIRLYEGSLLRAACGVGYEAGYDCATPSWAYRNSQCDDINQAAALFRSAVGTVIYLGGSSNSWMIQCGGQKGNGLAVRGRQNTTPTPPPVSCSANDTRLTLAGKVGERLKGNTTWDIKCTSPTALRMTISNRGEVTTTGGGTVRLTFHQSGTNVLNIDDFNPIIAIIGELTKSPTTAGTYTGSSVLLLEVL